MISNEALLAIIGVLSVLAGAWAYGYKQEQDRKTADLKRQIEEAKADSATTTGMMGLLQQTLTRMEQKEDRADQERKAWVAVVERNEAAKNRLADSVDQNSDKVEEMQEQFAEFREAVGGKFEAFKQQLESSLSAEGLGPILDVVFERFMKRVQGVVVHAPTLAGMVGGMVGDDDTLQLPSVPAVLTSAEVQARTDDVPVADAGKKAESDGPKPE